MQGILGRKAGMTTVFANDGRAVPVTVVEVKPNTVLQVKTVDVDGYNAIKLGVEDKKEQRATKAELGIAKKANTSAKYFIKEIRDMETELSLGDKISADIFEAGDYVDVTGISKGKGFQGSVKRHNHTIGPKGHGSKSHRESRSIGDIRGHVLKGMRMPGHMGHAQITMQNLEIVAIDLENNVILIKGSIPGPNKSFVTIKSAIKKEKVSEAIELVDVQLEHVKNELLEEAKKVGAEVNTSMSVDEMKEIISEASVKHEEELKEYKELVEKAKALEISNPDKMKLEELRESVSKAEELAASRGESAPVEETKEAEANNEEAKTEEVKEVEEATPETEDKKEEEA